MKGRIRFGTVSSGNRGENIAGEWLVYTSNAVADTEDTLYHNLGAIPQGYITVLIDKNGLVYSGNTAWDDTSIYLKCSTTSANIKLFLLK